MVVEVKPNKARLRLWVKALRSGKFKQGRGRLFDADEGYCCLGVACVVAKAGRDEWEEGFTLPDSVVKWFGLPGEDPTIVRGLSKAGNISASGANDTLEWSFKKIATAIEKCYDLKPRVKGKK